MLLLVCPWPSLEPVASGLGVGLGGAGSVEAQAPVSVSVVNYAVSVRNELTEDDHKGSDKAMYNEKR